MEVEQGTHTGKYLAASVGQTDFDEYSTATTVDPGDSLVDAALGFAIVHWAKSLQSALELSIWDARDVYLPVSPDRDAHPWCDFGLHHSYDTRAGSTWIRASTQATASFVRPLLRLSGTLFRLKGSCTVTDVTVSSSVVPDQTMAIATFSFG